MEKRNLRRMYADENQKKEYNEIVGVVKTNIESKVLEILKKNEEVVELQKKIDENQKVYFNKEEEIEFQVNYGFTDDYGEDYPDYRYSEELYKGYRNYLENFDKILADLYKKKETLESKFAFGKKRKLEDLEWQIKDAKRTYDRYMKIYEREQKSQIWYKDGKLVDINKPYKDRISEIKAEIAVKIVEDCFNKYPELMLYDFKGTRFGEDIIKAIENEQKSRVLTLSTKKGESGLEESVENQRQ